MNTYRKKVTKSILNEIMEVEPKNREEQLSKMEYLINFHKIMEDYDDVVGVLRKNQPTVRK